MSRLIDVAAILDSMANALVGTEQGEACAFAVRLMRESADGLGKHPDSERLDWLDALPSIYKWKLERNYGCVFLTRNTTSGHGDVRQAIDAARKEVQP